MMKSAHHKFESEDQTLKRSYYFRTPPFKCAVKSCMNSFYSFEERDKYPYKFHQFPNDRTLCNTWRNKCGLRGNTDVSKMMVCSAHFYLDDYQRNYKEEFANPNFKRQLKSNAVPTHSLLGTFCESHKETGTGLKDHSYYISGVQETLDYNEVKKTVDLNDSLQQKYKDLLAKSRLLKQKSQKLVKNTALFKRKLMQHQNNSVEVDDIQKVFSPSQINLLLGRKKVYWTDDDLARAFTLRHIGGKNCYLYLKNTLNMPLPALSCVQRWASSV